MGYYDDKIFLLSVEEYRQYKKHIPHVNCNWWLRSPGYFGNYASFVFYVGYVNYDGFYVNSLDVAVRPALKIENLESSNLKIGGRVMAYDFPWIVIDDGLAIAEVPIAFRHFDEESNYYEKSEIRKFLKDWIKTQVSTDSQIHTNADWIRNMSKEQLAKFLNCAETEGRAYGPQGEKAWTKWLNEERQETADE